MNEETVLSMVEKVVDGGEVELNFGDECYEAPTVLSNNEALVAKCNKLNVYLSLIVLPYHLEPDVRNDCICPGKRMDCGRGGRKFY